jgi:hypothetical protein
MAFKPNYNQQRAERMRAKQAKQDAKREEQEKAKAERRRLQQEGPPVTGETEAQPGAEAPDAA